MHVSAEACKAGFRSKSELAYVSALTSRASIVTFHAHERLLQRP
jgi:hypothetical protein